MKKTLFFALIGLGLMACTNETAEGNKPAPESVVSEPATGIDTKARQILDRYAKNQKEKGTGPAMEILAIDSRDYLTEKGKTVETLSDNDVINLFFSTI